MSRAAPPFSARAVLLLVLAGSAIFLLALYATAKNWDGGGNNNGGAHAAADGLNGFSAVRQLLAQRGFDVKLSRDHAALADENLLILTPQHNADGAALWDIVEERRYAGPTIVILPKWIAFRPPASDGFKAGWVTLAGAQTPDWLTDLDDIGSIDARVEEQRGWRGLNLSGRFPAPQSVQIMQSSAIVPLVNTAKGAPLAGYWKDGGRYPLLAGAAGVTAPDGEEVDEDRWPVVIVAEPDLLDNYGMADQRRAQIAVALIETTMEDYDLPIVFDLTVAGLGRSKNMLTLAFTPPFLAATLCLVLAALVIGWRAFRRFGAPLAEAPAILHGKRQLARNGAALVERTGRIHLLGAPYAALMSARITQRLGLRMADPATRDAAISLALAARGYRGDSYAGHAEDLRGARTARDLLRGAAALKTIERTIEK